jgi:hypothetical protein
MARGCTKLAREKEDSMGTNPHGWQPKKKGASFQKPSVGKMAGKKDRNSVPMPHLSYGDGKGYNDTAHGGAGRSQNALGATGKGKKNRNSVAMPHVTSGEGKGYSGIAHSGKYHGPNGEAVGDKKDQNVPNYPSKLQGEGAPRLDNAGGPAFVPLFNHGTANKAHHHPRMGGEAHTFAKPAAGKESHGYGHPVTLRKGDLRMSGHSKAHRIGSK